MLMAMRPRIAVRILAVAAAALSLAPSTRAQEIPELTDQPVESAAEPEKASDESTEAYLAALQLLGEALRVCRWDQDPVASVADHLGVARDLFFTLPPEGGYRTVRVALSEGDSIGDRVPSCSCIHGG